MPLGGSRALWPDQAHGVLKDKNVYVSSFGCSPALSPPSTCFYNFNTNRNNLHLLVLLSTATSHSQGRSELYYKTETISFQASLESMCRPDSNSSRQGCHSVCVTSRQCPLPNATFVDQQHLFVTQFTSRGLCTVCGIKPPVLTK